MSDNDSISYVGGDAASYLVFPDYVVCVTASLNIVPIGSQHAQALGSQISSAVAIGLCDVWLQ